MVTYHEARAGGEVWAGIWLANASRRGEGGGTYLFSIAEDSQALIPDGASRGTEAAPSGTAGTSVLDPSVLSFGSMVDALGHWTLATLRSPTRKSSST